MNFSWINFLHYLSLGLCFVTGLCLVLLYSGGGRYGGPGGSVDLPRSR